ncbi:MAG TPA: hypothetical protein VF828_01145 [Patescibacteria group bacterium]
MPKKEKLKKVEGGVQFDVAHDEEKVYKKPKNSLAMFFYGRADYDQIKADIEKIKEIFPEFYLETKVIKKKNGSYELIQDYIKDGKAIDLDLNKKVHNKLLEIRQKNRILIKNYGKSFDFLGNTGNMAALKSLLSGKTEEITISNIMVINGELKIIDLDLLDIRFSEDSYNPFHVVTDWVSYKMSDYFLKRVFGLKI